LSLIFVTFISIFITTISFAQISLNKEEGNKTKNTELKNNIKTVELKTTIKPNFKQAYSNETDYVFSKTLVSQTGNAILFPGEYSAFEINPSTQNIKFIKPDYGFDSDCNQAIERSPDWLRDDLIRQFRKLTKYYLDDDYASLINNADDNIVDEVAFQVAFLSYESLKDSRFRQQKEMLVENAQFIYDIVDSLKYVRLKEYGSFSTGDYYTTTEYRIVINPGDTVWKEIPKDIYYWYVVHPKLHDEGVYQKSNNSSTQQKTYGYFWRNYIWNNPNKNYDYTFVNKTGPQGTINTIQRFGEIIQKPEVLWERNETYYIFNRQYKNSDNALNVIGNWASRAIPVDAVLPRTVQPNQALFENNGNCGEDTYLLSATSRTALVPFLYTGSSGEDHVWGMIWDEDWYHYEFFRGGLEKSGWGFTSTLKGGTYESSGWTMSIVEGYRPDGASFVQTNYYTDISTLKINVVDKNGLPIDGAKVMFWCKPGPYYNPGWQKSAFQWTNHLGSVEIEIGDKKEYGIQVYHHNYGTIPSTTTLYPVISPKAMKDKKYEETATFDNAEMPLLKISDNYYLPKSSDIGISINFNAEEILVGTNNRDVQNSQFAYKLEDKGAVSFFLCDENNYDKFINGENFESFQYKKHIVSGKMVLPLPNNDKWYFVFSNQEATTNYEYLEASCELVSNPTKLSTQDILSSSFKVYPNPANKTIFIESEIAIRKACILDITGKKVIEKTFSQNKNTIQIEKLESGFYFVQVFDENNNCIRTDRILKIGSDK
ncbi:MAG: T9SS type A sorting domain-containing protein, partial [Bacteroidota bacterium]|nr:T9SS type A sorting domain-containing protein [Bacteroidota bacterium]